MTLPSRSLSEPEPSTAESESVTETLNLSRRLRTIGAGRLLHAHIDWDKLTKSAEPPGAAAPSVAKATLTRDSQRRWKLARLARRGATPAFRLQKAIQGL